MIRNFSVLVFAAVLLLSTTLILAQGSTIFNTIPSPLPGSMVSQPYQAQQTGEYGDIVGFAGSSRNLLSVQQVMVSWACESGHWTSTCTTTSGATFSHDITLNIYEANLDGSVGALLGTITQPFSLAYRPSSTPACGDGRWSPDGGTTCYNGYAFPITFDVSSLGLVVPDEVIYSIAYNTSNYGADPMGLQPCSASVAGCPYDSLNVALGASAPTTGNDPAPSDAYWDSQTAAYYCDGGLGGTGTFRLDAGCWTGYNPVVRFFAAFPASTGDQCKNNGWKTRTRADGSTFKNQGDCVSYTKNGK